jgi:hypothetical protein
MYVGPRIYNLFQRRRMRTVLYSTVQYSTAEKPWHKKLSGARLTCLSGWPNHDESHAAPRGRWRQLQPVSQHHQRWRSSISLLIASIHQPTPSGKVKSPTKKSPSFTRAKGPRRARISNHSIHAIHHIDAMPQP